VCGLIEITSESDWIQSTVLWALLRLRDASRGNYTKEAWCYSDELPGDEVISCMLLMPSGWWHESECRTVTTSLRNGRRALSLSLSLLFAVDVIQWSYPIYMHSIWFIQLCVQINLDLKYFRIVAFIYFISVKAIYYFCFNRRPAVMFSLEALSCLNKAPRHVLGARAMVLVLVVWVSCLGNDILSLCKIKTLINKL